MCLFAGNHQLDNSNSLTRYAGLMKIIIRQDKTMKHELFIFT